MSYLVLLIRASGLLADARGRKRVRRIPLLLRETPAVPQRQLEAQLEQVCWEGCESLCVYVRACVCECV